MNDKIEEIRARYAGYSLENFGNAHLANEDRGWLLAEVDKLRAGNERLRVAATSAGAALAAAIELLERGRKDAPSKRIFSQMIADYRVIVARTRKALEGEA